MSPREAFWAYMRAPEGSEAEIATGAALDELVSQSHVPHPKRNRGASCAQRRPIRQRVSEAHRRAVRRACNKRWAKLHPEAGLACRKRWARLHPEAVRAIQKRWRDRNPDYQSNWRKQKSCREAINRQSD